MVEAGKERKFELDVPKKASGTETGSVIKYEIINILWGHNLRRRSLGNNDRREAFDEVKKEEGEEDESKRMSITIARSISGYERNNRCLEYQAL